MKCLQTKNIFGERLGEPCAEQDITAFHVTDTVSLPPPTRYCRPGSRCFHHVPIYTDFELFVQEILDKEESIDKI